ncbi:hypothetical protein ANCCEY_13397 [Ancylostoma ceylanicum]|uniref:Uncharacterized protein n=1 Tax=Ancylostoma ceylanicum TaxID=53326 RepID=A0A0D6LCE5_9BILA|nr:hypothetical protein ANCCEY_13397 [Ancylostoma ceylanicum]
MGVTLGRKLIKGGAVNGNDDPVIGNSFSTEHSILASWSTAPQSFRHKE